MVFIHREFHKTQHIGWLRAAVMGANDGILSTASLIVGVAAASSGKPEILLAGIAGLTAGAMSMAAGEYVSVSSQADIENADISRERNELANEWESEVDELARIYQARGLEPELSVQVSEQLMAHDALGAHARDELGINEITIARPLQAALASAGTFTAGAMLPLLGVLLTPLKHVIPAVVVTSILALALLGGVAAKTGGAHIGKGVIRVTFWGAFAMALTATIGALFGTVL